MADKPLGFVAMVRYGSRTDEGGQRPVGSGSYDIASGLRDRISDAEPRLPFELESQLRALVWERLEGEAQTPTPARRRLFRRSSR
jgi:hypothetical protein